MPTNGQIILPQYNSNNDWSEKLFTPENGKVLGFDGNLNPVMLSKQDTLVSGTNIKTVNNQSLLGSGNITAGSEWTTIKLASQNISSTSYVDIIGFATPEINQNKAFIIRALINGYFPTSTSSPYATIGLWQSQNNTAYIHAVGGFHPGYFMTASNIYAAYGRITSVGDNDLYTIPSSGGAYGGMQFIISGYWTFSTPLTLKLRIKAISTGTIQLRGCVMEYIIW